MMIIMVQEQYKKEFHLKMWRIDKRKDVTILIMTHREERE